MCVDEVLTLEPHFLPLCLSVYFNEQKGLACVSVCIHMFKPLAERLRAFMEFVCLKSNLMVQGKGLYFCVGEEIAYFFIINK